MKSSSRKGQGAMEYLMTYGWAILVVMIVGVVLWQMGIFSNSSKTINRCNDFEVIKCFDPSVMYKGGSTPVINATFINGLNVPIVITSVSTSEDCIYSAPPGDTTLLGGKTVVSGGEVLHFACPMGGLGALKNPNKLVGDPFTVRVNITYQETVAGTLITRTEIGRLKGFVE